MNETAAAKPRMNPALLVLIIGGVVLGLIGVVVWASSANALDFRTDVSRYSVALGGFADFGGMAQAQLGVAIGVGLVIVGVVMLVAGLIVRAATAARGGVHDGAAP